MATQEFNPTPQPEDGPLADIITRHFWRLTAIHQWALRRGVEPIALADARRELHLSDEDVAAEMDAAESNVVQFPTAEHRPAERSSSN